MTDTLRRRLRLGGTLIGLAALAAPAGAAGLEAASGLPQEGPPCATGLTGNREYRFQGHLRLDRDEVVGLEGVQVRVVRQHSATRSAARADVVTGPGGYFDVTCKFARDRDGPLPGAERIRFLVRVRFRDDELKIRRGGVGLSDWHTIARPRGCRRPGCMEHEFEIDRTLRPGGLIPYRHGYIWWTYKRVLEALREEGVGDLRSRWLQSSQITVIHPDRHAWNVVRAHETSWFAHKVHLAEDDWDDARTMIHELMHQWDLDHTDGSKSLNCLFDAHHKDPDAWRSGRCSGFMEGFAEAMAQELTQLVFGGGRPELYAHGQMRDGDGPKYPIPDLRAAQRTDDGWQNFLTFLWTSNEFGGFWDSADDEWCNPPDVSAFEVLRAIRDAEPRKDGWWPQKSKATFEWFTDVLQAQVEGFGPDEALFYRLLGDPSRTAQEIREGTEDLCDDRSGAPIAAGIAEAGGGWQTVPLFNAFDDPVVIAGPPSHFGPHPGVPRLRNVSGASFEVRFQEWDYRARNHDDGGHGWEDVPYLAVDAGVDTLAGAVVQAGTFALDGTLDWAARSFPEPFPGTPRLFLSVQTHNGAQAVTVRARRVGRRGFEAALVEEQALNDGHAEETVGFVAIHHPGDDGDGTASSHVPLGDVGATLGRSGARISGGWTAAEGLELMLDEEESSDAEVGHVEEEVHVASVRTGRQLRAVLAQAVTDNGGDPFSIRHRRVRPGGRFQPPTETTTDYEVIGAAGGAGAGDGAGGGAASDGGVPVWDPAYDAPDGSGFPTLDDVPPGAGSHAVPRAGTWTEEMDAGSMSCGPAGGMTLPARSGQEGTIDVRSGGDVLLLRGFEEDRGTLRMEAVPERRGRYRGVVETEQGGRSMPVEFRMQVVTDELIVGYLEWEATVEGLDCRMYRTYRLRFVG